MHPCSTEWIVVIHFTELIWADFRVNNYVNYILVDILVWFDKICFIVEGDTQICLHM